MTMIEYVRLGFTKIIHLPLFGREPIQAFSHPDPRCNEKILDALDEMEMAEDLEDVLEDKPIN